MKGKESTIRNQAEKVFDALEKKILVRYAQLRICGTATETTHILYCSSSFVTGRGQTDTEILYSVSLRDVLINASSAVAWKSNELCREV